jgi:hypothetical protein
VIGLKITNRLGDLPREVDVVRIADLEMKPGAYVKLEIDLRVRP